MSGARKTTRGSASDCPVPICPAPALEQRIKAIEGQFRRRNIAMDQEIAALKLADSQRDDTNDSSLHGIHDVLSDMAEKVNEMWAMLRNGSRPALTSQEGDGGEG